MFLFSFAFDDFTLHYIIDSDATLQSKKKIIFSLSKVGVNWMSVVVSVGALFSITGGAINNAFCFARAIYVMGRDGLLPAAFATTNEYTQTPVFATVFGAVVLVLVTVFIDLVTVTETLAFVYLFELVVVAMVCIMLRYSKHEHNHGYQSIDNETILEESSQAALLHTDNVGIDENWQHIRMRSKDSENLSTERTLTLTSTQDERLQNTSLSSRANTLKKWINENPGNISFFCLFFMILNTFITIFILSYKLDNVIHGNVIVIFILIVTIVAAVSSTLPLWFLKENLREIPFKVMKTLYNLI